MTVEAVNAEAAANALPKHLMGENCSGSCRLKQVLNNEKTGLFWKNLFNKNIFQDKKTATRFETPKNNIILMLIIYEETNLSLMPLAICHS